MIDPTVRQTIRISFVIAVFDHWVYMPRLLLGIACHTG